MSCQLCTLPDSSGEPDYLFLWPPQGHTLDKVSRLLGEAGTAHEKLTRDNCIRLRSDDPAAELVALAKELTELERIDTRVLMTARAEPTLADFGSVLPFDDAIGAAEGAQVLAMLESGRFMSVAQPIVDARTGFLVCGHEFLFRGFDTDGGVISPGRLFGMARDPRTLFNLDRMARISAVETAARLPGGQEIFVNFMPGSVYDPNVCLRTTVKKVVELAIDPQRVVFEVVESDSIRDLKHLAGIVDFYRAAGFRIALDDFGAGFNNLGTLMALRPDFIKLDKSIVPGGQDDVRLAGLVERIVHDCHDNGIQVLAEGVENERQAAIVAGLGVDRMQGYHFGKPQRVEELL